MNVEIIKVGDLGCNCYLLNKNDKVLIIDPGDDFDRITEKIGNREIAGVIITHRHFDHIGALDEIVNEYKVDIYDIKNLSEGDNMIDQFNFEVIYTPGHKEDCITIYFKEDGCMFSGDFIFKDTIGRWDLLGGDIDDMYESINKIRKYDRDIKIYPGHGDSTSLGYELDNNIYF